MSTNLSPFSNLSGEYVALSAAVGECDRRSGSIARDGWWLAAGGDVELARFVSKRRFGLGELLPRLAVRAVSSV